jgi:hypothetical protein
MTANDDPPRYCPERALPPYSYVPGLSPHPQSNPLGHSFGHREPTPSPLEADAYRDHATYCYALDLFNHGYYWEAHEAWESLWHAAGRRGATAAFLKGLIKLAAAGVKAREGRAAGVQKHARRAVALFCEVRAAVGERLFGLRFDELIAAADAIAANGEVLAADGDPAERRLPIVLNLE